MAEDKALLWKLTAIGLAVAGVTAMVTGLVVANRVGTGPRAAVEAPAASPATGVEPSRPTPVAPAVEPSRPIAPAPAAPPARTTASVPPQSVIDACNRQATVQTGGAQRDTKGKATEVVKDGAIGAVGGAAVGVLGGAIADGGKGAGKGALIGGLVGAGGGSLYGIYANKQHDERYRTAYASCMKARGFVSEGG